jgi:hypothetical protein
MRPLIDAAASEEGVAEVAVKVTSVEIVQGLKVVFCVSASSLAIFATATVAPVSLMTLLDPKETTGDGQT